MITQIKKFKLYRLLVSLLVMLWLGVSFSFAGQTLDLQALIKEAQENNPDILAARKRWEASLARVPQAKSLENPSIGLTLEKIPRGTLKLQKTMSEDRMLTVSQFLPWFGKLSLKGKIATVESQMYAAEYKNKELEVINEVKHAYHDLFLNAKETQLSQQSRDLLEHIAKISEARYVVGDISQEELFKLNLELARLNNNILNLKAERKAQETQLNSLLNRNVEASWENDKLYALSEDLSFGQDIDSVYKLTLENQPELLIFSYAIEKNKFAKALAKRSFFPDLMASIIQRGITSGTLGPWDLMLSFSVPFWFWAKQRYEVKEAVASLEEAEAAYQAMKNKALSEAKGLYTKIEIAQNKLKLYKSNLIPILESTIEVSLAGFRSGQGDSLALLDNQRMLIETKMEYYQALVEYHMNLADLERQIGQDLR